MMYGLEEAGKEDWEETTSKVEEFLKASFGFTYRVVDFEFEFEFINSRNPQQRSLHRKYYNNTEVKINVY